MTVPLDSRRPRPVADAPVDDLVADAQELAKRWLLELVACAPLAAAGELPVAQLAREAPSLCAALARAVADDEQLGRLSGDGDLAALAARGAYLAGARDPAEAVLALGALRRVMWAAIGERLATPSVTQVSELAERLAHVIGVVLWAGLKERDSDRAGTRPPQTAPVHAPGPSTPFSLRDTREQVAGLEGNRAWNRALERHVELHRDDGAPIAALLVELDGLPRLLHAETGREVAGAVEAAERAIRAQLCPADALVREEPGRYWILASKTDRPAALGLAARLDVAVRGAASHRGVALTISVGIAISPSQAAGAHDLAALAEESLFAARAGGHTTSDPSP